MFSLARPDIASKVKSLPIAGVVSVYTGRDSLDQLSEEYYGSTEYWSYLAYYNDILDPFNLVSQGLVSIKLFKKHDLDKLEGVIR